MVARTPPKQKEMAAALNPVLLREAIQKMDRCMARLEELQSTVTGAAKAISGTRLSSQATRGYSKPSHRRKQESLRMKNNTPKKSPVGKFPANAKGEWHRMSLPAMLVGETVGEILKASQFARQIVSAVSTTNTNNLPSEDPKTPETRQRKQRKNPENSELGARRRREKQIKLHVNSPSLQRARSRISFKPSPPPNKRDNGKENFQYLANRISPGNRPWAKKAVLFPNPLFHSLPSSDQTKFCKTRSPAIVRNRQTPHKFLIKSPASPSKLGVKIKSPTVIISPTRGRSYLSKNSPKASTASKLRRSLSPARLANRLVSPLRSRKGMNKSGEGISGFKRRPVLMSMQFPNRRA